MIGRRTTLYMAAVARGIYLAQDRSDIGYAVKESSRKMAKPTKCDHVAFERSGGYLAHHRRLICFFEDKARCLDGYGLCRM
jgi:hypothetical protein